MAKDIVVLGYDSTWDKPVEQAFQRAGRMIWYVNEKQPAPNTHLANVLNQRYNKFIEISGLNYSSFFELYPNL